MKKILWCGDSTVVGRTSVAGNPDLVVSEFNEAKVCTDLLLAKFGAGSVVSVNAGRGGSNIVQWCYGDASAAMLPFAEMMSTPVNAGADIVVLQIGINDSFNGNIKPADYSWCLSVIYNEVVKKRGKELVLCTPCPIDNLANVKLWGLQNNMKLFAKQFGVKVVDHYSAILSSTANWKPLLSDKIHPTDDLYRFKGNTTFLALCQYFQ